MLYGTLASHTVPTNKKLLQKLTRPLRKLSMRIFSTDAVGVKAKNTSSRTSHYRKRERNNRIRKVASKENTLFSWQLKWKVDKEGGHLD